MKRAAVGTPHWEDLHVPDSTTYQNPIGRIYMDNAATSFPKPPEVTQAMVNYAHNIGASAGRGAYAEARRSAQIIRTCRERLNMLFNGENPDHFIFTLNCTDALNLAIHGWLNPGDHAICIAMDHNSILRPLNELVAQKCITQTRVEVDPQTGLVDAADIRQAIKPATRLIALGHASNVTGTVQNIQQIGNIAREAGIAFLVDAAQTAGHLPIDVQEVEIDFLACPGHKGLLGPLGTGFLYIRPGREKHLRTLRQGGTGSVSEKDAQPDFMPDRFEAGSHNAIGIAGLSEGVNWILRRGISAIARHEQELCATFIETAAGVEGLRFFGPQGAANRIGVFSVRIDGWTPPALAEQLEKEFGILTRPGLHCAPLAHQAIGTHHAGEEDSAADAGTTRLSFGALTQKRDVQFAAEALATTALGKAGQYRIGSAI
jgi:cysteine desulfurase / selenocysteine lyase